MVLDALPQGPRQGWQGPSAGAAKIGKDRGRKQNKQDCAEVEKAVSEIRQYLELLDNIEKLLEAADHCNIQKYLSDASATFASGSKVISKVQPRLDMRSASREYYTGHGFEYNVDDAHLTEVLASLKVSLAELAKRREEYLDVYSLSLSQLAVGTIESMRCSQQCFAIPDSALEVWRFGGLVWGFGLNVWGFGS